MILIRESLLPKGGIASLLKALDFVCDAIQSKGLTAEVGLILNNVDEVEFEKSIEILPVCIHDYCAQVIDIFRPSGSNKWFIRETDAIKPGSSEFEEECPDCVQMQKDRLNAAI